MNDTAEISPPSYPRALAERLDGPIEDVSIGVSAMLGKFVRQALRGGVQKMDEELADSVRDKIDADLQARAPKLAAEARAAAQETVDDQLQKLLKQAKDTAERINSRLGILEEQAIADRSDRVQDRAALVAEIEHDRARLSALQREYEGALAAARMEARTAVAAAEREAAAALEAQRDDLAAQRQAQAAALAQARAEHAAALGQLRGEQADALAAARTEFQAELAQAQAAARAEAAAARAEFAAAHAELRRQSRAELAALEARHAEAARAAAAEMQAAVAPVAGRLDAVEGKVFRPGLLGRLLGKKGGPPAPG